MSMPLKVFSRKVCLRIGKKHFVNFAMEYIYMSVLHITSDLFYNVLEIEIYKYIVVHYCSNISYPKMKIQEEMQSV